MNCMAGWWRRERGMAISMKQLLWRSVTSCRWNPAGNVQRETLQQPKYADQAYDSYAHAAADDAVVGTI